MGQGRGRAGAEAFLGPWAEILGELAGSENTASGSSYQRRELARVSPTPRGFIPAMPAVLGPEQVRCQPWEPQGC